MTAEAIAGIGLIAIILICVGGLIAIGIFKDNELP